MKFPAQMQCSLDSGLIVVVFIISCLLWVVGLLLFYDFGNICDKAAAVSNDSSMVRLNVFRAAYRILQFGHRHCNEYTIFIAERFCTFAAKIHIHCRPEWVNFACSSVEKR